MHGYEDTFGSLLLRLKLGILHMRITRCFLFPGDFLMNVPGDSLLRMRTPCIHTVCFRFIRTLLHTSARNTLLTSQEELQRCDRVTIQCRCPLPSIATPVLYSKVLPVLFVVRNRYRWSRRFLSATLALEVSVMSPFVSLLFVRLCCRSRAAATEREDQVQCRAAFEGVLFSGLVVGPVREESG